MWVEERKTGFKFVERYTDPMTGKTRRVSVVMEKNTAQSRKLAAVALSEKIDKALLPQAPKLTLKELVDLCKKGNEQALSLLYKTYSKKMMRICLHYIPDKQIAQDLLHDGFIVIFTSIETLRTPEKLESWMGIIMKNISLRYLNQKSTNSAIPLSDIPEDEEPIDNPLSSDSIPYDKITEMVEKLPGRIQQNLQVSCIGRIISQGNR